MKIPFDIKFRPQIESGEYKVMLDCGVEAEILAWDKPGAYPIVCMAKKVDAIPFRTDNNGIAYHYPKGSNYSNLYIITPEPELTSWQTFISGCLQKYGLLDCGAADRIAKVCSAELLALAREQFIKDGYVIEKKAFHDAVEKVDPDVMKEVSDKVDMEEALRLGYEKGRADALKDLPRWRKWGNGACGNGREIPLAIVKQGLNGYKLVDSLGIQGEQYIMLSDLEKLPGFKED